MLNWQCAIFGCFGFTGLYIVLKARKKL